MKGGWGLKGDRREVAISNSGFRIGLANASGPVLCLCGGEEDQEVMYMSGVGRAPDIWRDYKQLTPSCVNASFRTHRCSHCDEDDECKAVITGFALCLSPP